MHVHGRGSLTAAMPCVLTLQPSETWTQRACLLLRDAPRSGPSTLRARPASAIVVQADCCLQEGADDLQSSACPISARRSSWTYRACLSAPPMVYTSLKTVYLAGRWPGWAPPAAADPQAACALRLFAATAAALASALPGLRVAAADTADARAAQALFLRALALAPQLEPDCDQRGQQVLASAAAGLPARAGAAGEAQELPSCGRQQTPSPGPAQPCPALAALRTVLAEVWRDGCALSGPLPGQSADPGAGPGRAHAAAGGRAEGGAASADAGAAAPVQEPASYPGRSEQGAQAADGAGGASGQTAAPQGPAGSLAAESGAQGPAPAGAQPAARGQAPEAGDGWGSDGELELELLGEAAGGPATPLPGLQQPAEGGLAAGGGAPPRPASAGGAGGEGWEGGELDLGELGVLDPALGSEAALAGSHTLEGWDGAEDEASEPPAGAGAAAAHAPAAVGAGAAASPAGQPAPGAALDAARGAAGADRGPDHVPALNPGPSGCEAVAVPLHACWAALLRAMLQAGAGPAGARPGGRDTCGPAAALREADAARATGRPLVTAAEARGLVAAAQTHGAPMVWVCLPYCVRAALASGHVLRGVSRGSPKGAGPLFCSLAAGSHALAVCKAGLNLGAMRMPPAALLPGALGLAHRLRACFISACLSSGAFCRRPCARRDAGPAAALRGPRGGRGGRPYGQPPACRPRPGRRSACGAARAAPV